MCNWFRLKTSVKRYFFPSLLSVVIVRTITFEIIHYKNEITFIVNKIIIKKPNLLNLNLDKTADLS